MAVPLTTSTRPKGSKSTLSACTDVMRVVAMVGIVWVHTDLPWASSGEMWLTQAGKFATPMFFFISGYLFALNRRGRGGLSYAWRRVENLIPPYAVWLAVTTALVVSWFALSADRDLSAGAVVTTVLAGTAMWFIPHLVATLLVSAFLFDRLGPTSSLIVGGFVTTAWAALTYTSVTVHHSVAPLGFVAFTVGGMWWSAHEEQCQRALARLPLTLCAGAAAAAYVLAVWEASWRSSLDTLRPANLLFSIAIGVLIVNVCRARGTNFRERRRGTTYGVYLVHTTIALTVTLSIGFALGDEVTSALELTLLETFVARLTLFAAAWGGSLFVVAAAWRSGLQRLVGAPAGARPLSS